MKRLFFTLLFTSLCLVSTAQSQKGVWLTDVASEALDSDEGIQEVVDRCAAYGINQIYVVVWNRGYTLYPSAVMEKTFGVSIAPRFEGKDILKELITRAHEKNIKVHAWFEFGFSSSYKEEDGGHILRKKPDWAAKDKDGNIASKNGFQWMNAFHPEVQEFLISLFEEVVTKYDIDGVQGDDRLPANPSLAGYDAYTVSMYKLEHQGNEPPKEYKEPHWVQWRADLLNDFMGKLYHRLKGIDPEIIITMAPSSYPWSKEEYLQDWPVWVENDWVEQIIPQMYRYDLEKYQNTVEANLKYMPDSKKEMFIPGVLLQVEDYNPSETFLRKTIEYNRSKGLEAEVFFFYEGLKAHEAFFLNQYKNIK